VNTPPVGGVDNSLIEFPCGNKKLTTETRTNGAITSLSMNICEYAGLYDIGGCFLCGAVE